MTVGLGPYGTYSVGRVIFAQQFIGELGGIHSVNRALAREFRRRGVAVSFVSLNRPVGSPPVDGDVFVCRPWLSWTVDHPLSTQYAGRFGGRLLVKRILTPFIRALHRARSVRFLRSLSEEDVLLLGDRNVASAFEGIPSDRGGAYLVAHGHTSYEGYKVNGWLDSQKQQLESLDQLIVLTPEDARQLAVALSVDVGCLPNPSDVEPLAGAEREKVVVSVGRLSSEKRVDLSIRAFDLAADDEPGWRLLIYGDGTDLCALRNLAATCRHGDRIEFRGRTNDVSSAFSTAELAILTSAFEGQPMAVIEAARCGTPTVAVGCVPEVTRLVGGCGFLTDDDTPGAVAATLLRAMRDERERRARGRMGAVLGQEHAVARIVDQWLRLFETRDPRVVTLARPDGSLTVPSEM